MSRQSLIPWLVAVFISASLVFLIQPLFAKLVLPRFGGVPAVWNTCSMFFQTLLLLGYCYTWLSTRWLQPKAQIGVHCVILLSTLAFLPIGLPENLTAAQDRPILNLLGLLALTLGGPYFAVSTTTPLLQHWFSGTSHTRSGDPYFLYAVSNAGSMIGLLAYPFVVERLFDLNTQQMIWSGGYATLILLTIGCGILRYRTHVTGLTRESTNSENSGIDVQRASHAAAVTAKRRFRWIVLAFVPSVMMLAVTTRITTEVAAVPLLWVAPLAVYLATFINAFARRPLIPAARLQCLLLPSLCIAVWSVQLNPGSATRAAIEVWLFALCALVFHGELADDRPDPKHLTEYYFWMSLGGSLGGMLVGIVAPVVFNSMLEQPIALVAAALMLRHFHPAAHGRTRKSIRAVALLVFAGSGIFIRFIDLSRPVEAITCQMVGFAAIAAFYWLDQPRGLAVGVGMVTISSVLIPSTWTVFRDRSFFGVVEVQVRTQVGLDGVELELHQLKHGTTNHGEQLVKPESSRCLGRTYYGARSPLGEPLLALPAGRQSKRVGVIGLGAGSLQPLARSGDHFDYFEIDPVVRDVATDPTLFSFLTGCGKGTWEIIIGDGRLKIATKDDHAYDVIVLDAFGSDSIPVHLLTAEALDLYLSKLSRDGVLIIHISNRFIDLEPVLGRYAKERGYAARNRNEFPSQQGQAEGYVPTQGIVIARDAELLEPLPEEYWTPARSNAALWTDRFSSILDSLRVSN